MASPAEYGAYIIDITSALLEHSRGLNDEQIDQIGIMRRRAVGFVTDYLEHEARSIKRFSSYLNHDAMSPLTVIVGYAEMLLMGASGDLTGPYLEAVQELRSVTYALIEELKDLQATVHQFLIDNPQFMPQATL